MISVVFTAFVIVFAICQGAAVVGTAAAAMKVTGIDHWAFKAVAVIISYVVWFVAGSIIWVLLGGGGGIMDGGMPFFLMSVTSIFGSLVVGVVWLVASSRSKGRANG